jgi:hypothetical protein
VEQEAGPKPEQKTDTEGQEELEVQMTSNGILRHALDKVTSLQPKECLHVLCPVGVHPLLEFPFWEVFSQEERRQTTVEEAMVKVLSAKIFEISRDHERELQLTPCVQPAYRKTCLKHPTSEDPSLQSERPAG